MRGAVRSFGAVNLQLVGIRVDLDIARGVFVMQKQQRAGQTDGQYSERREQSFENLYRL